MTREEKLGATDDQALIVHTKNNFKKKENFHRNKKKDKKSKKTKRDTSNVRCYTCDEKGHFTRDCPCYPLILHLVGFAEEPPFYKHNKCLFPV